MVNDLDQTPHPVPPPTKCPACGRWVAMQITHCPQCGKPIPAPDSTPDPVATRVLQLRPLAPAQDRPGQDVLDVAADVILKFLPSETSVSVPLHKPLVLGRGRDIDAEAMLDLTDFGALEHGVSRRHCQLQRRGSHLRATDMGSTNGTSLNGQPMLPHREYQINDGDRLALGSLPIVVTFAKHLL
jgi:pSer/pThr/pTyr-binding forkhead associated (FHA) protein